MIDDFEGDLFRSLRRLIMPSEAVEKLDMLIRDKVRWGRFPDTDRSDSMATVTRQRPTKKSVKKKVPVKKGVKKASTGPARAPSGYFSQIITQSDPGPFIVVVHGVGGVGKTSWAAHAPSPVFLIDDQELGIFDLMSSGQLDFGVPVLPKAENWNQVMGMLDEVENQGISLGYKSLILDSTTGFEYLCFRQHCDEAFGGDWSSRGFFNYQQGPKNAAKTIWPDFLRKLLSIRNTGMNVILIAHSHIKNFNNPEGPDFDRWTPYLDKEIWATTFRVMENVFFMNHFVDVQTDGKKTRGKGVGKQRFIYTEWHPAYDAKNRWGLPDAINMGGSAKEAWEAFEEQIPSGDDE